MSDFAASAMMRLIQAGLKRQRLELAPLKIDTPGVEARVPLADKRAALTALHTAHGLDCLLRIGEAIDDVGDEPALTAMLLARDPINLLARWQRLERFIHSRHRIAVTSLGEHQLLVRHYSVNETPPLPAEDALVIGLLVLLVERIGAIDVRARPNGSCEWTRRSGRWQLLPNAHPHESLADWEIQWSHVRTPLSAASLTDSKSIAKQLTALMTDDPAQSWTLANAAGAAAISRRTLQRRLQLEGTSFQRVLRESRISLAAKLLTAGDASLSEIGYRAGFADQAHFQREFRVATAMTPMEYRKAFLSVH
ncbi:MAG: helix-turn-helix transcriptional regulator [Casimicrobium sp.]